MAQPTANERQSYFKRILKLLTEPSPMLQHADQRRQAQFLAALTLLLFPFSLMLLVLRTITTGDSLQQEFTFYVSLFTAVGGGLTYALSRGRYYRLASIFTVASSSLAPFMVMIADQHPNRLETAIYLTFPVILSSSLLSMRITGLLTLVQTLVLLLIPSLFPVLNNPIVFLNALSYYLIASTIVILVMLHRKLLEQDRQRELQHNRDQLAHAHDGLEQRVHERTAELLAANARLTQQIAERQQAEAALTQERTMLRTLIDNLPDQIFVINRQGEYLLDNAAHSHMMAQLEPEEMLGKTAYDIFDTGQASKYREQETAVMETGQALLNLDQSYVTDAGEEHFYLMNKIPLRDSSGQIIGMIGIGRDITERKLAEDALQVANAALEQRVAERTAELSRSNDLLQQQIVERLQAEDRLRYQANLLQNVTDAIIGADQDYCIRSWNPGAEIIYGWSASEVIGRSLVDVIQPLYADGVTAEQVAQSFLKDGFWHGEVSHLCKDGHRVSVLASASSIKNTDGTGVGIVNVNRDITQRKQIEAAEREQRVLAESLRDSAAAINSTLNLDDVLDRILVYLARVMSYDAATIMLVQDGEAHVMHGRGFTERGLKMEDVLALRFPIALHGNLQTMYEAGHAVVIPDTTNHADWRNTNPTQWIRSYVGAPIRVEDKVIGFVNLDSGQPNTFNIGHSEKLQAFADQAGIAIRNARLFEAVRRYADDLENRVAERTAELEKERAHLHTILNSMTEGVVGQMFEGDIVTAQYVNKALVNLMGYPAKDWNFQLLRPQRMTPEQYQARLNQINAAIMQDGIWKGETYIQRSDGTGFDASITTTRIDDSNEKAIGTVTIIRDISQEKALQEQKSRFVANASHELRTPITNLMTRLYLLRKQPERLEDHLQVIENVTQRMRNLVEDLLDHSRFERGVIPLKRRMVNVYQLIEDVVQVQEPEAQHRGIHLSTDVPILPLMINADPGRMTQVLTNLITNAIHYTREGGWIKVKAHVEQETDQDFAIIEVQDSGIGIVPEALPNIFNPFYRSSEDSKGVGLGLSITREIIKMHGGDISVQSEPGVGSQFTIKFALTPIPS